MGPLKRAATMLALAASLASADRAAPAADARSRRLKALEAEMVRLKGERDLLESRERGVLGDLARTDADLALRTAEAEAVALRLRATEERLGVRHAELTSLLAERKRRAAYLSSRLRELYKRGPAGLLARALGSVEIDRGLDGLRYASYLARRDAVQLAAWRDTTRRLTEERTALAQARQDLASLQTGVERSRADLARGRSARAALLASIRSEREQHDKALRELEAAAHDLGRLVESLDASSAPVPLDVRPFRGLLDWPADGPVSQGFGTAIHPRFKTQVPHPGLDLDAGEGAPFRSVFDGRVAFAASLHGYGLTVIVDHGNGVMSVYAHAGAVLVEAGQEVARGQDLGRVGESGSLRGPYLYFELRENGRPVDPARWLRRR